MNSDYPYIWEGETGRKNILSQSWMYQAEKCLTVTQCHWLSLRADAGKLFFLFFCAIMYILKMWGFLCFYCFVMREQR